MSRTEIDGEAEPSREELLADIGRHRSRWEALLARAYPDVTSPGVAGDWTLRDVVAHMNAYLRFWVSGLGGQAREFAPMPDTVGFDMQKRNEWMHEADKDLPWGWVALEHQQLQNELIRCIKAVDLGERFADWHPWPRWRWMCDARNHYEEHAPLLERWLEAR